MDIHVPKAAHSPREFLIELGTIVAGILIALGLEQAVEAARHYREAAEARDGIREELIADVTRMNLRVRTQACIDRRLDELQAVLDRAGPDGRIARPGWIGRPSRYVMETNRWEAAAHSGRFSLLGHEEQATFGNIYEVLKYYYEMENGEQLAWARLQPLQDVDRLSPDGMLAMRTALSEARFYNRSARQVTMNTVVKAHEHGLGPTGRVDRAPTACWPITLTRAEAKARLEAQRDQP